MYNSMINHFQMDIGATKVMLKRLASFGPMKSRQVPSATIPNLLPKDTSPLLISLLLHSLLRQALCPFTMPSVFILSRLVQLYPLNKFNQKLFVLFLQSLNESQGSLSKSANSSPFYPGKTTFGGASAHRKMKQQSFIGQVGL